MKTRLLPIALAASFAIFSLHADADDKELKKNQVPQPVLDAFAKAWPNAKVKGFEQETRDGKTVIEIEFKENGVTHEHCYSSDGTLLGIGEEIRVADLPPAVVEAINKAHPNARIKEAERKLSPNGTLSHFEVEIKVGGKELELEIDRDGKILKTEKD